MDETRTRYAAHDLLSWLTAMFASYGMSPDDAAISAEVLLDADLAGIETHGVSNLGWHHHYASGLESGEVSPAPDIAVLRDSSVAAAWDAGRGFGLLVGHRAMTAAIDKAEAHGLGMITVRDGCHLGALGYYARMAAERGFIGLVMSHTSAGAVPPGGAAPGVGTNPLAFGAPIVDRDSFVLDMAVTNAAGTKVIVAAREGRSVPLGWIVDRDGHPTTDPTESGGLLLLGAGPEGGGHKGFGLGLMVDILSGILSGTGSGIFQRYSPEWRIGYWMAAVRIEAFIDRRDFDREMLRLVDAIHAIPPAEGSTGVVLPGERAAANRRERVAAGVPLDVAVLASCNELADRRGVPFPVALRPES